MVPEPCVAAPDPDSDPSIADISGAVLALRKLCEVTFTLVGCPEIVLTVTRPSLKNDGLSITRFHMPGVRNQQLTFGELHHMLGEMALFGGICATIVQRSRERIQLKRGTKEQSAALADRPSLD